jgi:hypothetical protein
MGSVDAQKKRESRLVHHASRSVNRTTGWSGHCTDQTKPPLAQQSMPEPAASPVGVLGRRWPGTGSSPTVRRPRQMGGVRAHVGCQVSTADGAWPRRGAGRGPSRLISAPRATDTATSGGARRRMWRVNARAEPKLGGIAGRRRRRRRRGLARPCPVPTWEGAAPEPTHPTPRRCPLPRPLDTWNRAWPAMAKVN